jgi:hypothetical protein
MFDKRDLQRRARQALHTAMKVEAIYHSPDRATAVPCTIRVHDRQKAFGDMTGFDYDPSERMASVPEIVMLADEVSPARGGVFSLAADEQYQVETPMPRDGLTITAQVSRRSTSKIAAEPLAYPGQV